MAVEIKVKVMPLYGKQEYIEVDYAELTKWSSEQIEAAYGKECEPQLMGIKVVVSDTMKDNEIMLVSTHSDYMQEFFKNFNVPSMVLK